MVLGENVAFAMFTGTMLNVLVMASAKLPPAVAVMVMVAVFVPISLLLA